MNSPADLPANSDDSPPSRFDPHENRLTRRDWSFVIYILVLAVVPLVITTAICLTMLDAPGSGNLPQGPAPMGPDKTE